MEGAVGATGVGSVTGGVGGGCAMTTSHDPPGFFVGRHRPGGKDDGNGSQMCAKCAKCGGRRVRKLIRMRESPANLTRAVDHSSHVTWWMIRARMR